MTPQFRFFNPILLYLLLIYLISTFFCCPRFRFTFLYSFSLTMSQKCNVLYDNKALSNSFTTQTRNFGGLKQIYIIQIHPFVSFKHHSIYIQGFHISFEA